MRYLKIIYISLLPLLFISCTKNPSNIIKNGVNLSIARSELNTYRTAGFQTFPAVAALALNDTLCNAAYNFAVDKANDPGVGSDEYTLSNSHFILNYPGNIGFHETAIFALFYGYPVYADTKAVVDAGFIQNTSNNTVLGGLMNSNAKRFGMAQFGGRWYLIISN
jgi:hypothetical protein